MPERYDRVKFLVSHIKPPKRTLERILAKNFEIDNKKKRNTRIEFQQRDEFLTSVAIQSVTILYSTISLIHLFPSQIDAYEMKNVSTF